MKLCGNCIGLAVSFCDGCQNVAELAARLEFEQSRRDYRESWNDSREMENSAWDYTSSAYYVWARETNR